MKAKTDATEFAVDAPEISWRLLSEQLAGLKSLVMREMSISGEVLPLLDRVENLTHRASDFMEKEESAVQILAGVVLLEAALELQARRLRAALQSLATQ